MADSVDVGIDLGTTFSVIARLDEHGEPVAIPNAEGELSTPSVVHVNADGSFVVGAPATGYLTDTARAFKRYMARPQGFILAGREYTAEQLSAEVLRKLVADASAAMGAPIRRAVISVPAHFGYIERETTRRAGSQVGLTVLQVINEPTAAANVYARQQGAGNMPGHVIVFDLGGGTLDITLVEMGPEGASVKRTDGTISLGGQDFTDSLVKLFAARYQEAHDHKIDDAARSELNRRAEEAKIALTQADTTSLIVSAPGGPDMPITITRPEFEQSIRQPLGEIEALTELLIYSAELEPKDISKVLLVGGSSRVPSVRAVVRKIFGQEPDESLDPDLAVAWGAALVAGRFARDSGDLVVKPGEIVVRDSVSRAIGVKTARQDGTYGLDFVLSHGSPLETWSTPRHYAPRRENEAAISVEVFQGEVPDPSACDRLGALVVELSPGARPDNSDIRVWMRLNRSGILEMQVAVNDAEPTRAEFHV